MEKGKEPFIADKDLRKYLAGLRDFCDSELASYIDFDAAAPMQVQAGLRLRRPKEGERGGPDDVSPTGLVDVRPGGAEPDGITRRVEVVSGLREYAEAHVLLTGAPGSGKSTALRRLCRELAAEALENPQQCPIPVLIELRGLRKPHLALIRDRLADFRLNLGGDDVEDLARSGRFFFIFDGVNEIPAAEHIAPLEEFIEQTCRTTPVVVCTRDLRLGGSLRILRELEMQPLTHAQALEFADKRTGGKGKELISSLKGRMAELARTPLFLAMICNFHGRFENPIEQSPGKFFRQYCKLSTAPDPDDPQVYVTANKQRLHTTQIKYAELWHDCFSLIGFRMLEAAEQSVELRLPKAEVLSLAEKTLHDANKPSDIQCAIELVDELLKFHLLRYATRDHHSLLEFQHQLFAEYYAAEHLAKLLQSRADGIDDAELKWNFLNKLRWTEVFLLVMDLLLTDDTRERLLRLAMELDLRLFARLLGHCSPDRQRRGIELIETQTSENAEAHIRLLASMNSVAAVSSLKCLFADRELDRFVRLEAGNSLANIDSDEAVLEFKKLISGNEQDKELKGYVSYSLGRVNVAEADSLLKEVLNDEDHDLEIVVNLIPALMKYGNDELKSEIKEMLNASAKYKWLIQFVDELTEVQPLPRSIIIEADNPDDVFLTRASTEIRKGSYDVSIVSKLIDILYAKKSELYVKALAAENLVVIGSDNAFAAIRQYFVSNDVENWVKDNVSISLALNCGKQVASLFELIASSKEQSSNDRERMARGLGSIGGENSIAVLRDVLSDKEEDSTLRWTAAHALGQCGGHSELNLLLTMPDYFEHVWTLQDKLGVYRAAPIGGGGQEKIVGQRKVRLIFMHGLGSNGEAWTNFINTLRDDEFVAVHYDIAEPYSYPTVKMDNLVTRAWGAVTSWDKRKLLQPRAPRIQMLANHLRTRIQDDHADADQIILICHSMGGLIARQYLLEETRREERRAALKVCATILFATPNDGSDLAKIARFASPMHPQLRQLCTRSDFLNALNEEWKGRGVGSLAKVYYVAGLSDEAVDERSASAFWESGHDYKTVNATHECIIDVRDSNHESYKRLITVLRTIAGASA